MNTIDDNWTFKLNPPGDPIRLGPQFRLVTDAHEIVVYKAKDSEVYHVAISERKKPCKRVYESRFDSFYVGSTNPNVAKNIAITKLSRFSL